MTTFLIILAVYLLSVVAMYFITKFMYLKKVAMSLAPVWAWVTPVVNTAIAVAGFAVCWNYFPITGLEYWKKKWDAGLPTKKLSNFPDSMTLKEECYISNDIIAKTLDEEVDRLTADWTEKEIAAAGTLISKRKKSSTLPADDYDAHHRDAV